MIYPTLATVKGRGRSVTAGRRSDRWLQNFVVPQFFLAGPLEKVFDPCGELFGESVMVAEWTTMVNQKAM